MTPEMQPTLPLAEPKMVDRPSLLLAGLMKTYTPETMKQIPLLWKELDPHFGKIPGQVADKAYGVVYNLKDGAGFAYFAGVEVTSASEVPDELNVVRIPDVTYAVFPHNGHLSTMRDTINAIWTEWLPTSGVKIIQIDEEMPGLLEQYDEKFDPATGMGGMEIWVPVKNRSRMITFEGKPEAPGAIH